MPTPQEINDFLGDDKTVAARIMALLVNHVELMQLSQAECEQAVAEKLNLHPFETIRVLQKMREAGIFR